MVGIVTNAAAVLNLQAKWILVCALVQELIHVVDAISLNIIEMIINNINFLNQIKAKIKILLMIVVILYNSKILYSSC